MIFELHIIWNIYDYICAFGKRGKTKLENRSEYELVFLYGKLRELEDYVRIKPKILTWKWYLLFNWDKIQFLKIY